MKINPVRLILVCVLPTSILLLCGCATTASVLSFPDTPRTLTASGNARQFYCGYVLVKQKAAYAKSDAHGYDRLGNVPQDAESRMEIRDLPWTQVLVVKDGQVLVVACRTVAPNDSVTVNIVHSGHVESTHTVRMHLIPTVFYYEP